MDGLEKKVSGDWFDIKNNADDVRELEEYFDLKSQDFAETVQEIRLSVEEGIIEYKRKILFPLFNFLESLKYDSKGFDDLIRYAKKLGPLIYVLFLQRLIARGTVPLKKEKVELDNDQKLGIKEIIQDVNDRIQMEQEVAQRQPIKNILAQVSMYKKELENMKKLYPNIPKEKAEAFSDNFKKTFTEINNRIEENYSTFIKEEIQQFHDSLQTNPLSFMDLKPAAKLLFDQAQIVSKIKSTLTYAETEGFQTRASLVGLEQDKEALLRPFQQELKEYKSLADSEEQGLKISSAFCNEIIYNLNKIIKRLQTEQ